MICREGIDARDNHPMLHDYRCYLLIASTGTALRRAIAREKN